MDAADDAQQIQECSIRLALDAAQHAHLNKPSVSALECEECGNAIPQSRRDAVRGCTTCIACQQALERHKAGYAAC